jgi:hypothetical protein
VAPKTPALIFAIINHLKLEWGLELGMYIFLVRRGPTCPKRTCKKMIEI